MAKNKQQQLQQIVDNMTGEDTPFGCWSVEFRGRGGWWVVSESTPYFGYKGDYLGEDFKQAKKQLGVMFARR